MRIKIYILRTVLRSRTVGVDVGCSLQTVAVEFAVGRTPHRWDRTAQDEAAIGGAEGLRHKRTDEVWRDGGKTVDRRTRRLTSSVDGIVPRRARTATTWRRPSDRGGPTAPNAAKARNLAYFLSILRLDSHATKSRRSTGGSTKRDDEFEPLKAADDDVPI